MNSSQDPAQIFGYEVHDSAGNKIGKVDNVWVDDATNELEFVGVKTGWLMGKTHVIPVANAQISDGTIQVPFDEERIKSAPSFSGDEELTQEQEDEIYGYYGEGRSTEESPSGMPATGGADFTSDDADASSNDFAAANTASSNYDSNADQGMTLHEERLEVGKRQVDSGQVRLRKVVHTEHQEVPVDLRREEVQIERVPASDTSGDGTAFQDQEISVPRTREEAVVGTQSRVTEQVRLNKTVSTDTENVGGDVRREEVETDGTESNFTGQSGGSSGNAGASDYENNDVAAKRDRNY